MFDFYFQSGEFVGDSSNFLSFASDFVVQIAGTFVGAWFAIKLYRKQTQDQRDTDLIEQENKDLDNMRYLDFMLRNSIVAAEGLVKSYRQFAEELPKTKNSLPDLEIFSSYSDVERIAKVVNQGEFYHSYNNLNRKYRFDLEIDSLYYVFVNIESVYHNINNGVTFKQTRCSELEKEINSLVKMIVLQNRSIDLLAYGNDYTLKLRRIRDEYDKISNTSQIDRLSKMKILTESISHVIDKIDLSNVEENIINIHNVNSEMKTQLTYIGTLYLSLTVGIINYAEMFANAASYLNNHSNNLKEFLRRRDL